MDKAVGAAVKILLQSSEKGCAVCVVDASDSKGHGFQSGNETGRFISRASHANVKEGPSHLVAERVFFSTFA